jgi:hypothetical protein
MLAVAPQLGLPPPGYVRGYGSSGKGGYAYEQDDEPCISLIGKLVSKPSMPEADVL